MAARQQTHEDSGLITTLREEVQEANEKIQELQADQVRPFPISEAYLLLCSNTTARTASFSQTCS